MAPFDQVFPVALEDVNVTEPPVQKDVGPPAVIVGVFGAAKILTTTEDEEAEQEPFDTET